MQWIAEHPVAYPFLEVLHLAGVGLVFGNLILIELRVLGFGSTLGAVELARLSLFLVGLGFVLCLATGLVMFATQPLELLGNRAFTVKMGLLLLAAGNAAWFHARSSLQKLDRLARVLASVSALIWLSVIAAGRWIAYI